MKFSKIQQVIIYSFPIRSAVLKYNFLVMFFLHLRIRLKHFLDLFKDIFFYFNQIIFTGLERKRTQVARMSFLPQNKHRFM